MNCVTTVLLRQIDCVLDSVTAFFIWPRFAKLDFSAKSSKKSPNDNASQIELFILGYLNPALNHKLLFQVVVIEASARRKFLRSHRFHSPILFRDGLAPPRSRLQRNQVRGLLKKRLAGPVTV
jgi:hypothetical protein